MGNFFFLRSASWITDTEERESADLISFGDRSPDSIMSIILMSRLIVRKSGPLKVDTSPHHFGLSIAPFAKKSSSFSKNQLAHFLINFIRSPVV